MKKYLILVLLLTWIVSCKNQPESLSEQLASAQSIKAEIISGPNDILSEPGRITYQAPLLVYNPLRSEKAIECFDVNMHQVVKDVYDKGKGPQEMLMVGSLNSTDSGNVYVYDIMKKAEYRMNLDSGTLTKMIGFDEFAMQGYYSDAQHICLLNGPFNEGRFKLYKNGELSDVYKHFPQILQIKGDTAFLNQGYQNVSALSPDGTKFANMIFDSEILEGYSLKDGKIQQRWSHEWSMLPFSQKSVGDASFVVHSEDSFGFKSISVTNRYIYCLYSDKTDRESKPNTANGNYVFVFDWGGVLKKTFLLNHAIRNLAVSTDDKYLYGTAVLDNDVKMLQYTLE